MRKRPNKAKGILLLAFVFFAVAVGGLVYKKYQTATTAVQPPPQAPAAGTVVATLFFASPDGDRLVREGRELDVEEDVEDGIEGVVEELIRGPLGDLAPTLPQNARVLDVQLKGNVAQINFGPELVDGIPSGSSAESVAVYSVVDTVAANFPQVKAVQFEIDGKVPETLKGHLDLKEPIAPDFSIEEKPKPGSGER